MNFNAILPYILTPLVGGVIGYLTNALAIKMLFRPHTSKYIFGWHIPLTPGIIPKEKYRIADAIGGVISKNLMNKEVLEKFLLSIDMINKIRTSVESFLDAQKKNQETVKDFLLHYISEDEMSLITTSINEDLTKQLGDKLSDSSVGKSVAHIAVEHIAKKFKEGGAQEILSEIGGIIGMFSRARAFLNIFLDMVREPIEKYLGNQINKMLQDHGKEIVSNLVGQEIDAFLNKKVCDLLQGRDSQLESAVNTIENLYRITIKEHLHHILQTIDISKIVSERIKEMDVNETEKLILQIMDKELKAIEWLGALLGLIIGCINLLY